MEAAMPVHAIVQLDVALFAFINSHHNAFFDYFFWTITQLGNAWVIVPLVGLAIAVRIPRRYMTRMLACALVAGTLSGILSVQIKRAVSRPRPIAYFETHQYPCAAKSGDTPEEGPDGGYSVHVVGKPWRNNSFPSGHTVTAFSAATIVSAVFGGYSILAFAPALLVAYSRVYMGVHFPLDTLGGAALGVAVPLFIFRVCRRRERMLSASGKGGERAER